MCVVRSGWRADSKQASSTRGVHVIGIRAASKTQEESNRLVYAQHVDPQQQYFGVKRHLAAHPHSTRSPGTSSAAAAVAEAWGDSGRGKHCAACRYGLRVRAPCCLLVKRVTRCLPASMSPGAELPQSCRPSALRTATPNQPQRCCCIASVRRAVQPPLNSLARLQLIDRLSQRWFVPSHPQWLRAAEWCRAHAGLSVQHTVKSQGREKERR